MTKIREPFANAKGTEGHKSNHFSSYDFHQEKEDKTIYIEFRFFEQTTALKTGLIAEEATFIADIKKVWESDCVKLDWGKLF